MCALAVHRWQRQHGGLVVWPSGGAARRRSAKIEAAFYIPLATTRRTHSTKFSRVFAFMIVLCFRGVFEGARRNGTIRLAQFNHFRGEKHNCLLPLPLSWCYACCVCCASCVFRSGASESASGSLPTRSTRSAGAKRFTPIIPPPIFFFLPCFHPCTLPQTCSGSQWN